jgi:excisionase family DNA binding protein
VVTGSGGLSELLRGPVAAGLYRALMRDQTVRVNNGRAPERWELAVLQALAVLADVPVPQQVLSASGHPFGSLSRVDLSGAAFVSTREAAALVGRSERTIRRYAAAGRIRSRKDGRDHLVDVDSLTRVLGRAVA